MQTFPSPYRIEVAEVQAEAGVDMTFSKAVWKSCISWGVPTVMRTEFGQMGYVRPM